MACSGGSCGVLTLLVARGTCWASLRAVWAPFSGSLTERVWQAGLRWRLRGWLWNAESGDAVVGRLEGLEVAKAGGEPERDLACGAGDAGRDAEQDPS